MSEPDSHPPSLAQETPGDSRGLIAELERVRTEASGLLALVSDEQWIGRRAQTGQTCGTLFAAIVADLDMVESAPIRKPGGVGGVQAPAYATDFIKRRLASKLSSRFDRATIGQLLEQRHEQISRMLITSNGPTSPALKEAIARAHDHLAEIRAVIGD